MRVRCASTYQHHPLGYANLMPVLVHCWIERSQLSSRRSSIITGQQATELLLPAPRTLNRGTSNRLKSLLGVAEELGETGKGIRHQCGVGCDILVFSRVFQLADR